MAVRRDVRADCSTIRCNANEMYSISITPFFLYFTAQMSVDSKKQDTVLSDDDKPYDSDQEEYDEDEEYDEEDEDETDEDDDSLDEPKLRYRRVGASVKELLDKDTASTLRVSDRFVVSICNLRL